MKKLLSVTLAVGMLAFTISPAIGVTIEELQAQIAALMQQLQQLQGQQGQGGAYNFTRDLTIGMRGDDVTALQNYLISTGHFTYAGGATGYFGPITKAAVAAWQAANGISPAAGYFGPISRAKYAALMSAITPTPTATETPTPTSTETPTPTPTPTSTPAEGSIEVKLNPSPANNTEVNLGESAKAVMAFDVKAKNSDVTLKRIDIQLEQGFRPWIYFTHIGLYEGDNAIVGVTPTSANSFDYGSSVYGIRFDGLNYVVPKDTTKTITVKVAMPSSIVGFSTSDYIDVKLPQTGIRFVDTLGISTVTSLTEPLTRSFYAKVTEKGELEVSLNANTPAERVVQISETAMTEDVEALKVDLKAKKTNSTLKRLVIDVTDAGGFVSGGKLYDGDTLLASAVVSSGALTFDGNLSVALTKDVAKTLTVKLSLIATSATSTASVSLTGSTAKITAEDANYMNVTTISGTATGKTLHLYTKAPQLALVSGTLTAIGDVPQKQASGSIKVKVTAIGGDIYIQKSANDSFAATSSASSTAFVVNTVSGTTETTHNWKIASGQEAVFEVSLQLNNESASTGKFVQAWLYQLKWNTNDSTTYTTWINKLGLGSLNEVGEATLKTNSVYLSK